MRFDCSGVGSIKMKSEGGQVLRLSSQSRYSIAHIRPVSKIWCVPMINLLKKKGVKKSSLKYRIFNLEKFLSILGI